jgi:hypothetical protein
MSNDSKLGLLAGVATVILIAVVYFQNGLPATQAGKPSANRDSQLPTQSVAITPVEPGPKK